MYSNLCVPLSYDTRNVFSLFSVKYMGSCPLNRKDIGEVSYKIIQLRDIAGIRLLVFGSDPNRIGLLGTSSSEAIPLLQELIGVLASYATHPQTQV